jgi:response regulator RpfG family c-di-GMP phosphodiesterase
MSFENPTIDTSNENTLEMLPAEMIENHIQNITEAKTNNYEGIKRKLVEEGHLSDEVLFIKDLYKNELEAAHWMEEKDWEMLAVMNVYDEATAEHCIRTYILAKEKLEKCHLGGIPLKDHVSDEAGMLDSFYRACLFHDIGKCCLPHEVLNNTMTESQLADTLFDHMNSIDNFETVTTIQNDLKVTYIGETENELKAFLQKANPVRYAPLSSIFEEDQVSSLMVRFPGINSTSTLLKVISFHEKESERVLKEHGDTIAAIIAGGHHNYDGHKLNFPIASDLLEICVKVEEILMLADIQDALTAERKYKSKFPILKALKYLVQEARLKNIHDMLSATWVRSELEKFNKENLNEEDTRLLKDAERFVRETLSKK